ncbi:signal peptidase I [Collibacillus ludicampi]|uniref:Signal peptidase I n=1 Tax=Collibacillus ludicampi TaxID=2771369 RepID=A0AAV4LIG2_9BACL|nr:signal peptidase I [Collibacillus ludicampi]GIM47570.1 signal peptidase I [Collibacillus ludicampi]
MSDSLQEKSEPERKEKAKNEMWDWIRSIAIALLLALLIREYMFAIFMVDGESMIPTLQDHERLVVNKLIYHIHKPQDGEIIIFKYPADPSKDFVKRVMATPGETIEVKNNKVYRNGQPLDERYLVEPTLGHFGPVTVPPGHVFAMGDNRNYSKDSRDPSVGFVPYDNIVGRADLVIWPFNKFNLFPYQVKGETK